MAKPYPELVNVTGITDMFNHANNIVGGSFGKIMLVPIFVVATLLIAYSEKVSFVGALAIASYITFLMGSFFWLLDLIAFSVMNMYLLLCVIFSLMWYITK